MNDFAILLGHYSLLAGLLAAGWGVIGALLAAASSSGGLQKSAERAVLVSTGFVGLATLCLIRGFLANDFRLDYVYFYSSTSQAIQYKIGALWGGQAGSLQFSSFSWCMRTPHILRNLKDAATLPLWLIFCFSAVSDNRTFFKISSFSSSFLASFHTFHPSRTRRVPMDATSAGTETPAAASAAVIPSFVSRMP